MGKKQNPKSQWMRRRQQRHNRKPSQLCEESKHVEQSQHCDAGLPVDALYEILVRTPVKTLSRLRCVSKQWCSLISSTSFQVGHHRHNCREYPLLLKTRHEDDDLNLTTCLHVNVFTSLGNHIKEFSIAGLPQARYESTDSCMGFVCIYPGFNVNLIIVCNPTTEEVVMLPPTRGVNISLGFGYAASSKEFKVIRFFIPPEQCTDLVTDLVGEVCSEVFTFGTSGWRKARNPPPQYPDNFFIDDSPFLHGALHLAPDLEFCNDDRPPCLFSFDIETEVYTMFPLPEDYISNPLYGGFCLKVIGGSLCLISAESDSRMQMWCVRDYNNREWVKSYFIDAAPLGLHCFNIHPLVLMADGSLMVEIKANSGGKIQFLLYYYNSSNNSFTEETTCNGAIHFVESSLTLGSTSYQKENL